MMEWLRRGARSPIAAVLLGLLVLAFGILGTRDAFSFRATQYVATIDGRGVSEAEIRRTIEQDIKGVERETGRSITLDEARQAGLVQRSAQNLLDRIAVEQSLGKMGIVGSKEELFTALRAAPVFQDSVKGGFSLDKYRQFVRENFNIPEKQFENEFRSNLAVESLIGAVTAGYEAPDILAQPYLQYVGETREARLWFLPIGVIPDPGKPSDAQLKETYDAFPQAFARPERRKVTLVSFAADDFVGDVTISDAELQAAFETRKASLAGGPRITFEQTAFATEEAAAGARRALTPSADFGALAKAVGAPEPTRIEKVLASELKEARWAAQIGVTPKGGTVGPFKSDSGWLVARILDITPPPEPKLADHRAALLDELKKEKAAKLEEDAIDAFENARGKGDTLEAASEAAQGALQTFSPFDANGTDKTGAEIAPFAGDKNVLDLIFRAGQGETLDQVQLKDQSIAYIRIDAVTQKGVEPLAEVKPLVTQIWAQRQLGDALEKKVKEFSDAVKAGTDPALAARAAPMIPAPPIPPLARGATNELVNAQLNQAIFAGKLRDVVSAPETQNRGIVVALIDKITIGSAYAQSPILAQAKAEALKEGSNDLFAQYRALLQKTQKSTINQARLKAITQPSTEDPGNGPAPGAAPKAAPAKAPSPATPSEGK